FGAALILCSLVPAGRAAFSLWSDITRDTRYFGSNPIQEGEHYLGEWALRFLVLTLLVTPVRQLSGWNWLAQPRRTLGPFAFTYGLLHWLTYVFLDNQLDFKDLIEDIMRRPYILIGSASLLLMLPLAVTSTTGMIRRLGGKRWNLLHKLVFPACILGVIHFW